MQLSRLGERAVVVGGGIAGLAAAGVLARRFDQVDLLERDHYEAEPSVRPHAPQGAHVHILLAGGLHALTRLVPALPGWLDAEGLPEGDLTEHVRLAVGGRWLAKVRSGIPVRSCTRPMLEHLLLRDDGARGNVRVVTGCEVLRVEDRGDSSQVHIRVDDEPDRLDAALIVDASGRSSLYGKWLRVEGRSVVEDVVDGGVLYSPCGFEIPGALADDWMVLAATPEVPRQPNSAAIMRLGGNRLLVAMIRYGRPQPPTSPEEMLECMRALSVPEIHALLSVARPTSRVHNFSNTANRFRRYASVARPIPRVVVIGDPLCSLNPRHGQGMTTAAIGAEQLALALAEHRGAGDLTGFARDFQHRLTGALRQPWEMALI
ncbi:MAG: FAD-dependent monooxygenase, partial [Myxococcales bacterium]|nr:FAD-dependent monooxygenase [Myxococcales bacterium]